MPIFSEPKFMPYRVIIFGDAEGKRPEAIFIKGFRDTYSRDAAAKDLPLKNGQTAIAVTVDFLIAGGDEPKR